MINYTLQVTRLSQHHPELAGFALDTPQQGQHIQYAFKSTQCNAPLACILSGWILAKERTSKVALYWVSEGSHFEHEEAVKLGWLGAEVPPNHRVELPASVDRPDAVSAMLSAGLIQEPCTPACGFHVEVPFYSSKGKLVVVVGHEEIPLFELELRASLEVIRGDNEWLFLDSDTNQSVAQFTGKLALSFFSKLGWRYFLSYTSRLSTPFALLVAPSKETIVFDAYPYTQTGKAPVEQVIDILPLGYPLVYPVDVLRDAQVRAYRKNDTHWGLYGAQLATESLLVAIGLERECRTFAHYQYKPVPVVGDLGNKLYPPLISQELALTEAGYARHVVYDNQLANFGRVLIVENESATADATMLMFASSSGYSMLHFLYRVFKRIVFVHTAGALDTATIQQVEPDYIVSQTNARFMIRAPKVNVKLGALISKKLRTERLHEAEAKIQHSADELKRIKIKPDEQLLYMATFFHQMMHTRKSRR